MCPKPASSPNAAFLGGEDMLNAGAHPGTGGAAASDVRRHLEALTQSERPRFGHHEADASDVMMERLMLTAKRTTVQCHLTASLASKRKEGSGPPSGSQTFDTTPARVTAAFLGVSIGRGLL